MKSLFPRRIINRRCLVVLALMICTSVVSADAQFRLAVVTSINAPPKPVEEKLLSALAQTQTILDSDLTESVIKSFAPANLFNLSATEARNLGAATGCDFFVFTKSNATRRFSTVKKEYFESYVVIFLVSARTGRLVFSRVQSIESDEAAKAEAELIASANAFANEIKSAIKETTQRELTEKSPTQIPLAPEENSPEAKNSRPPLPYKRIKPAYTSKADLYSIEATVDVFVDIGAKGEILRTEISRWAGFGLDESVIEAVTKMRWRPATQNGKTLPMRVLLRYNFKNLVKTDD